MEFAEYIGLTINNVVPSNDMGIISYPPVVQATPPRGDCCEENKSVEEITKLSDFDTSTTLNDSLLKKTAFYVIDEVRKLDDSNSDKYNVYFSEYNRECSVNISTIDEPTIELIQRFSFSITLTTDTAQTVRFYIGNLFINKKYHDVGSNLLSIAKIATRSLTNSIGYKLGVVELYSVETAVVFYIKNGFIVKDLFWNVDPQHKVGSTHRMIEFAMKESNINIMKKYAKVTSDNFIDFIIYLLEKTKYGRYFRAYFDELDNPNDAEKSILQSRFISSIFNTNMIWAYSRDTSKTKVNLKPLTM